MKTSEFKDVLKTEIDNLENFKVKMESMGNFTQLPPHVHVSLSEVASITKPHSKIQEILRAMLLLLGEPEDTLEVTSDNKNGRVQITNVYQTYIYIYISTCGNRNPKNKVKTLKACKLS